MNVFEIASFSDKWKEIKERLETMNKDIVTKKQKKFNLDKLALSQGYAYKWTNRVGGRGQGRKQTAYVQSQMEKKEKGEEEKKLLSQIHHYLCFLFHRCTIVPREHRHRVRSSAHGMVVSTHLLTRKTNVLRCPPK